MTSSRIDSLRLRCLFATAVSLLALAISVTGPANAATLDLEVTDDSGQIIPCRILVRLSNNHCFVPEQAIDLAIGPDQWFMFDGQKDLIGPSGEIELRVERGPEFSRFKGGLEIREPVTKKKVVLKRWIDMKKRGYLCSENHFHVPSGSLGPMAIAEGLDFASSLTWWNGPDERRPVPSGSGKHRVFHFAGREIVASIYDAELEYAWGAAYIQNLPAPLPLPAERHRPNLDFLKHAVKAGATVHYQGGYSREVSLDALLGCVHIVNVCNNNFHLNRFQPRDRYSNLLDVEGFPIYANTPEGMMRMNTDSYYRLLNWGLRLAAGAGSATGAKQVPVGYNRAYVRIDSDASLDAFYAAWREGKNFVTNGPMLFFSAGKDIKPGGEIALGSAGGGVPFKVTAVADQPLTTVEIVVNGEVIEKYEPGGNRTFEVAGDLDIPQGAWIAARCTARDDLLGDAELKTYANGERQQPSRLRFAHTSPVYVTVGGRGAAVEKSIQEGQKMLDKLESFGRENAAPEYAPSFVEAIAEARKILVERGRSELAPDN